MNSQIMIFLLVMVICWRVSGAEDKSCGYAQCIFQGQQESKVDRILVQFNFANITEDFARQCLVLWYVRKSCDSLRENCRQQVIKPWEQRLTDDWYAIYIMWLAQLTCMFLRPALVHSLPSCFDSITHDQMQTCVSYPYRFIAPCAFKKFQENSQCSPETQDFVRSLIEVLVENPYNY